MKRLSIKLRVTLWYTLLMLILIALVLTVLLLANDAATRSSLEARLRLAVDRNMEEVEWDDGVLDVDKDFAAHLDGVISLVYTPAQVLLHGELPQGFAEPPALEDGVLRVVWASAERWGVYDRLVTDKDEEDLWVRGIVRMEAFATANGTLLLIALVALPLWLLLAAIGGYHIAGRALRPVDDLQRAAGAIAGGADLSLRVSEGEGKDEIDRLARTINGMLARLEASFAAERQFTADASHELRTPVAAILAQSEVALAAGGDAKAQQASLFAIHQQARRMSHLIAQLLAFARMEQGAGALALEETDASELTAFICEEWAEAARDSARFAYHIAPDIFADLDRTLYTRALNNLLDNAFAYGKPSGKVTLALTRTQEGFALSVRDEGEGIAPEAISRIWDRFYRADAARTAGMDEHTGLGLAMVRQIMLLHGGSARVESTPGEGSIFTLQFHKKISPVS